MIVLITGAYGGIGRAACFSYVKNATRLFITGRDQDKLNALVAELTQSCSIPIDAIATDINDNTQVKALFQHIAKTTKRLDVLLHCAGTLTQQPLMMSRFEMIKNEISSNLTSAVLFCQYASKLMMRNKQGVIILLSSIVANQGSAGQSVYGAAKAGIEGLVKSLAKELGSVGIRINAVAPGFIETALVENFTIKEKAIIANKTSLGRLGNVDDIVPVFQFLSSDNARYITGQVLAVDGGLVL
ncbi:MAG: 3-oxoacyl-[acyl-carrier protein] reductase [Psychroserpens sp.]|jgi:3-oxoacyl-[acyl-carrier protein] reductase